VAKLVIDPFEVVEVNDDEHQGAMVTLSADKLILG